MLLKFTKSHKPHRFLFAPMKFLGMKSPKRHKNNGQQVIKVYTEKTQVHKQNLKHQFLFVLLFVRPHLSQAA